jgi:hypothetical protein
MRTTWIGLVMFAAACAAESPPPTLDAADDTLAVEMNTPAALEVLDNDVGVDAARTVALVAAPMHGTAMLGDDGVLSYVPASDYLGDDGVDYTITNSDGSVATAHVAIAVGCATCAIGATITLAWDPNAPGDNVTGYRTYMGPSEDTSQLVMIDDIPNTQAGFDPQMPSVTYDAWTDLHLRLGDNVCFALTAYNTAGESGFSNVACTIVMKKAMRLGL